MRKIIIFILLILLVVFGYNYLYQKHRNIKTEDAYFTVSSSSISQEFLVNPLESESKYLNKAIEISGNITEINQSSLTLDNNVFCQFSDEIHEGLIMNSQIKIKGRFIGYDDLLQEIKLDQCIVIDQKP